MIQYICKICDGFIIYSTYRDLYLCEGKECPHVKDFPEEMRTEIRTGICTTIPVYGLNRKESERVKEPPLSKNQQKKLKKKEEKEKRRASSSTG